MSPYGLQKVYITLVILCGSEVLLGEEYVELFCEGLPPSLVDVSGPYSKCLSVLGSCQPCVSRWPMRFQRC